MSEYRVNLDPTAGESAAEYKVERRFLLDARKRTEFFLKEISQGGDI